MHPRPPQTSRFRSLVPVALALFAFRVLLPGASAISITEPPDFPNAAPGTNYVLTAGVHTFLGAVSSSDQFDYFNVTVPAGLYITQATKSMSGGGYLSFNGETLYGSDNVPYTGNGATPYPLPPGTYQAFGNNTFDVTWLLTITVGPLSDYTVSIANGVISVTDSAGNSDTLSVFEPSPGNIKFAAPGRTFSVNGGPSTTGDSGDLSLSGVTQVTVDARAGDDTINVGGFSGTSFPQTSITGGTGSDTVNFNGNITGGFLSVGSPVDAGIGVETINVAAGVKIVSNIDLRAVRNIAVGTGATLETSGTMILQANQQNTPTAGNFVGILLDGATLKATSNGNIGISGRGGNDASGNQFGVQVIHGAKIMTGSVGGISVGGTGGAGGNSMNTGVLVSGTGSAMTTTGGSVQVTGTGGSTGNSSSVGISIVNGGEISAGGTGTVTLTAIGAGAAGSISNHGFELSGIGSHLTSGGSITIFGLAGPGSSSGVYLADSGLVSKTAGFGSISITSDSVSIDATASITAPSNTGVQIIPSSSGTVIDLGGADAPGNPPTLGLTNAELSRISAGGLTLGQNGNSSLVISAPITFNGPGILLAPGSGGITATAVGTDLSLGAGNCFLGSPLRCAIAGPGVDTGYTQLKVAGTVNLNNRLLVLTSTYAGVAGDIFTIVDNDGTEAITGTFQGLPEGAYVLWPGSSTVVGRISYVGGTGNDVVLTLVDVTAATTVTNTANSGPGSLREAIASAAVFPGPNTITLVPALSGATIPLAGDISIVDNDLTIDATGLPAGLTLSGNILNRIFYVQNSTVTLLGLSFTYGTGMGTSRSSFGGAIANDSGGILTLNRCTFFDNFAHHDGGAIYNDGSGMITLTDCTFAGNSGSDGGAIYIDAGTAMLTHCTLAGNSATNDGGAIDNSGGTLTLANSIVAGNTSSLTHADIFQESGTIAGSGANLIGSNSGIQETFPTGPLAGTLGSPLDPLLAPLGNYGGTTQTMALLPGSPARNAAVNSTATSDQRGFPIVGTPDLGAYEAGTPADFHTWSLETTGTTPAVSSDTDGDGSGAGLEYALRLDPLVADAALAPTLTGPTGAHVFTFRYRAAARDLRYIVQRSGDIATANNWVEIYRFDTSTGQITETGVTADENSATEIITLADPAAGTHLFWRLQVQQIP